MGKSKINNKKKDMNSKKFLYFKYRLPINAKLRKSSKTLIHDNPRITSIQPGSKFIYDINTFEDYFKEISDKNNLKLKPEELLL